MAATNRKINHVTGLEESILSKYHLSPTNSKAQSLPNHQWKIKNKKTYNLWKYKRPQITKRSNPEGKTELEI